MAKAQTTSTKPKAAKPLTKAQQAKAEKLFGKTAVLEEPKGDPQPVSEDQRKGERRVNSMAFAVQQLQTPQAPATPVAETPPQLTEAFQKELEALKAKFGVTQPVTVGATAKPAKPKAEKIQQNGVTRPNPNSLCGRIWAAADEISAQIHGVASIAALRSHPVTENVNEHTIKTQYARWRAFNGVTGRLPTIPAVHQEKSPWNPSFGTLEKF